MHKNPFQKNILLKTFEKSKKLRVENEKESLFKKYNKVLKNMCGFLKINSY